MSERFSKLRKSALVLLLIESIALSLAGGILGFSVTLLIQKLCFKYAGYLACALIGIGITAIIFSAIFLIGYPSEGRLARKIDSEYLKKERVQTMLAFKDESSDMLELQRQDAEKRLEDVPNPKISLAMLITIICVAVIAIGLLITSLIVKADVELDDPPDDTVESEAFEFTEWQQASLKELIQYVKDSDLEKASKDIAVNELESLYDKLFTVKTRDEMVKTVTASMVVIDDQIEKVNTYEEIVSLLANSGDKQMVELAKAMGKVTGIPDSDYLDILKDSYLKADDGHLKRVAETIETTLKLGEEYKEDEIYKAILSLKDDFLKLDESLKSADDNDAKEILISVTLDASMVKIKNASAQQTINRLVGDEIIAKLMYIFDLTNSDLPESILDNGIKYDDVTGDYTDKEDDKLSDGGAGRDEMNYASDDEIYDPDLELRVKYGEVYKKYSARMREKVINGELPEEYVRFIEEYFSALYVAE